MTTPATHYRTLAAQLRARARTEDSPQLRAEWEHLAHCYVRLAEQADRNSQTDVSYEPILRNGFGDFGGEPA
jgi:hypothetical protein